MRQTIGTGQNLDVSTASSKLDITWQMIDDVPQSYKQPNALQFQVKPKMQREYVGQTYDLM